MKKWLKSKTVWFGILLTVVGIYKTATGDTSDIDTEGLQQMAEGISVIVLRFLTSAKLTK